MSVAGKLKKKETMIDKLISHISKFSSLSNEELEKVSNSFTLKSFQKKEYILKAGYVSKYECFIVKGCLRAFVVNGKGIENNIRFGVENSWIGDLDSFFKQTPATYYIQAIEPSTLLLIDANKLNKLMDTIPSFEHYFRIMFQYGVMSLQLRMVQELSLSAEERYTEFINKYPYLEQRIPQKQIASYLGMTPEFLSVLRKKTSQK